MARKPQALKRERFSVNTSPHIAQLLRAAASSAIKTDLFPALAAGRSLGLARPTVTPPPPGSRAF